MARTFAYTLFLMAFLQTSTASAQEQPRYNLYIFLAASCPISQQYTPTINRIIATYQKQIVSTLYMGHQSDRKTKKELRKFKARYRIQAPIVIDEADMLAKRLKAAITPEVFLVDASGNILYRGAIDNWFYALGKNRPSATEHFLEDAIQDILQGKDVRKPVTQAIGCYLEYKD